MNKSGLVFKVDRKNAVLITETGEFVRVMIGEESPSIGEKFTGVVVEEKHGYVKKFVVAAAVFIMMSFGGSAYAYYTPVSTVLVEINPSIEIKVNSFDRIIEATAKNEDGEKLLKSLELSNYKLEQGLILVVEEAANENYINDKYISEGKIIKIMITDNNQSHIESIDKFEAYIKDKKINAKLVNNGEETEIKNDEDNAIIKQGDNDSDNSKKVMNNDNSGKDKEKSNNADDQSNDQNQNTIKDNNTEGAKTNSKSNNSNSEIDNGKKSEVQNKDYADEQNQNENKTQKDNPKK